MNRALAFLIAAMIGMVGIVSAVPVEPHSPITIARGVGYSYTLSWRGLPGYTYFIQTSLNAAPDSWKYAPVIEFGVGDPLNGHVWGFSSTEPRVFVRLRYTDAPVTGGDPDSADFDGDGISNLDEVVLHGTDPLLIEDTDGDGLTDKQEVLAGTHPFVVDLPQITIQYRWRHGDAWSTGGTTYRIGTDSDGQHTALYSFSSSTFNPVTEAPAAMSPARAFTALQWKNWSPPQELIAHVHSCLAPNFFTNTGGISVIQGSATADCTELQVRLLSSRAVPFPITRKFLQLQRKKINNDPMTYEPLETPSAPVETLTIPANGTVSPAFHRQLPSWTGLAAAPQAFRKEIVLVPIEAAPDVLQVNSDFDEGRIEAATSYALPDCDDPDRRLGAERDHLHGRWATGTKVVEDLHQGWFGLRPYMMPVDFYSGATITITKVKQTDPATGAPESGQVRFYATGVLNSSGYQGIEAYDHAAPGAGQTTHAAVNLVTGGIFAAPGRSVYGSTSDILSTSAFWMEGVKPGKITLRWRIQKGSLDASYTQSFLVATQKSALEWYKEVQYQILLQTKVATGTAVNIDLYHHQNGFNTGAASNVNYVRQLYYYYRQLYKQMPEKFMWAGMAKVAAGPIFAGMSDLTKWLEFQTALVPQGATGGIKTFINDLLLDGQKQIFYDMAWTHRAYMASGLWAIEHVVAKAGDRITNLDAWELIDAGIRVSDTAQINQGNGELLRREQKDVVQKNYNILKTTRLKQPYAIGNAWFGSITVAVGADGLADAGQWLSANSNKNPLNPVAPYTPTFQATVPGGRLDTYEDRWAWTSNPTNGMLEMWLGTSTAGPNFDATKRLFHTSQTMFDAAKPYVYDEHELPRE